MNLKNNMEYKIAKPNLAEDFPSFKSPSGMPEQKIDKVYISSARELWSSKGNDILNSFDKGGMIGKSTIVSHSELGAILGNFYKTVEEVLKSELKKQQKTFDSVSKIAEALKSLMMAFAEACDKEFGEQAFHSDFLLSALHGLVESYAEKVKNND